MQVCVHVQMRVQVQVQPHGEGAGANLFSLQFRQGVFGWPLLKFDGINGCRGDLESGLRLY